MGIVIENGGVLTTVQDEGGSVIRLTVFLLLEPWTVMPFTLQTVGRQ